MEKHGGSAALDQVAYISRWVPLESDATGPVSLPQLFKSLWDVVNDQEALCTRWTSAVLQRVLLVGCVAEEGWKIGEEKLLEIVAYASNLSTWKNEAEGLLRFYGHPGLHSEFQNSMNKRVRHYLKYTNEIKTRQNCLAPHEYEELNFCSCSE